MVVGVATAAAGAVSAPATAGATPATAGATPTRVRVRHSRCGSLGRLGSRGSGALQLHGGRAASSGGGGASGTASSGGGGGLQVIEVTEIHELLVLVGVVSHLQQGEVGREGDGGQLVRNFWNLQLKRMGCRRKVQSAGTQSAATLGSNAASCRHADGCQTQARVRAEARRKRGNGCHDGHATRVRGPFRVLLPSRKRAGIGWVARGAYLKGWIALA
jgi:hypothetical protein